MPGETWLAEGFEQQRPRLRSIAYRMLGSVSEADDAVQETWLRLHRHDGDSIDNIPGWLTTVISRVCLNVLRRRHHRREVPWGPQEVQPPAFRLPDPLVGAAEPSDPEAEALLADSIGLALLVVLDTLTPAERLAFVLHDVFAVPYAEIAVVAGRSVVATRQLASRARLRIRREAPTPDRDLASQRGVVEAFFAAARRGDFDALLALLDPAVVLRADAGLGRPGSGVTVGAAAVAARARMAAGGRLVAATVNGLAGAVVVVGGQPVSVLGFTVVDRRILAIDALTDPVRLAQLDLSGLDPGSGPTGSDGRPVR